MLQLNHPTTYLRLVRIADGRNAHNRRQSRRQHVAANRSGAIHLRHDLHLVNDQPLEVVVVETAVRDQLLQKGGQLHRVVLVGFGQVEILEVENEALALFRPQHATRVGGEDGASLEQFGLHVRRRRLSAAVHGGNGGASDERARGRGRGQGRRR